MESKTNYGGARSGAGRKAKAVELKLIEKLSPMEDIALQKLEMLVKSGDFQAIKLFMEYMYGKPTMKVESDSNVNLTGIKLTDLVNFK